MPRIKVKNIPVRKVDQICGFYRYYMSCDDCPLNNDEKECCRKSKTDPNYVIELSEKDFPTNREWLDSLSDKDLAAFYTHGILIERYSPYPINIHQIIGNFMASEQGIEKWLSQPCKFLMEVDTDAEDQS